MNSRGLLRTVALVALLAGSGCAVLGPPRVDTARTGETVVRVSSPRTFEQLAEEVYGDASLGPALAELAGAPADGSLDRGDLLVVPPRSQLEARLRVVQSADARFRDGLAAADRGAYRQAADHFRAAADAAPHRVDYRYNLGLALLGAGEAAAATPVLEKVAQERPEHAASRYAFGNALRQRRAWDRAIGEYQAALRRDPELAGAAYALARTWQDKGDAPRARRAFADFLARFGDDPLAAKAREHLAVLDAQRDPTATPTP